MSDSKQKPKMSLVGHDGNIFAIMGRAGQMLKSNGQEEQALQMYWRVHRCGSYNEALLIVSEYVETELSHQPKAPAKKNEHSK